MKTAISTILVALFLGLAPASANTYDGTVTGYLEFVHVKSNIPTQSLVLVIEGRPSLCGEGTPYVALLDQDAPIFKSIVSVALAAFMGNKQVLLYSNLENGKCKIKQIRILRN